MIFRLHDIYNDIMDRPIRQQPTHVLAMRVLSWVVYALRPLTLIELQHALAIDELGPDAISITEDSLTPQTNILNICAGMIKLDERDGTVCLVHKTAQDYFDRNGNRYFPTAHTHSAQV